MFSQLTDFTSDNNYIFRENEIILQDNALPQESVLRRCLELQTADDWFCESDYNYAAVLLEHNTPNPAGCTAIPLREFFGCERADADTVLRASRARTLLHFRKQKRFCSRCGSPLRDDKHFTARTCTKCGQQFFPQLEPAIIVLVTKGDELLLARHKNRIDTIFTCIAGFVEAGETIEHAVSREVKEETNIDITNIRYVASQAWPYPDQLMLAFRAEYAGGDIQVQNEELHEAHWFKKSTLPAIPKPGSVAYRLITGEFD